MKNPKQQIKLQKLVVALHKELVNKNNKKKVVKKYNGNNDVLDFICNHLEVREIGFLQPKIIGYIHD